MILIINRRDETMMGDISVIARRLKDGHVQYDWSGNGGYCANTGLRLLAWYNDPVQVEYQGTRKLLYTSHTPPE